MKTLGGTLLRHRLRIGSHIVTNPPDGLTDRAIDLDRFRMVATAHGFTVKVVRDERTAGCTCYLGVR